MHSPALSIALTSSLTSAVNGAFVLFLVFFCHLGMSDALLGYSVRPAPGLYRVRSGAQSGSEMLCKSNF